MLAIGIAGPILDGASHAHVPLGLREPWGNLRIVNRPVFANSVEIRSLEVNIAEACRGASPKISLAAGAFAPLPVPIATWRVGIRNIVLEQITSLAVFGFFH